MAGTIRDKGKVVEHTNKGIEFDVSSRSRLARANEYFQHFNGQTTVPAGIALREEGTTTSAATYGIGLGGEATITSDDVAAKSDSLNGIGLLWECDRQPTGQPIVFEARWKAGATLTANEFWLGISDAFDDTDPIALSLTSTFTTSVPTDGAYIGYSDTPTSGAAFTSGGNQHTAISIINNTNAVVATGQGAFAASTYYTYRIQLDASGNAAYFVNGNLLGVKGGAVTATVPLTFVMYCVPRTTASAAMTIDYVYMGGK